jgi:hypothetical protein
MMGPVFSFWGWGVRELSFGFSSLFPMYSQYVPMKFLKLFPETFLIATQFYSIWSAQSSTEKAGYRRIH